MCLKIIPKRLKWCFGGVHIFAYKPNPKLSFYEHLINFTSINTIIVLKDKSYVKKIAY
jgi:hypothetical protein